jgi:hypothetical protein
MTTRVCTAGDGVSWSDDAEGLAIDDAIDSPAQPAHEARPMSDENAITDDDWIDLGRFVVAASRWMSLCGNCSSHRCLGCRRIVTSSKRRSR